MRLPARGLLATPLLGAILSLPTLAALLPAEARAGCADHYVTSRSRSDAGRAHLELPGRPGATPPARDGSSREGPTPCSGALCSGDPAPPPSTAPPVLPMGAGPWAIPASPAAVAAPGSLACPPADAGLRPVDRPCSIFHPPRSLTSSITV